MNQSKNEESIFCEALEIPIEKRAEFLRRACEGDDELMASVMGLLQLHDTEEEFLVTPAIEVSLGEIDELPGDRIGVYELEHKIGEGGFGVVWQAQQIQPIQRRVALKIVKLGMDSDSIITRFDGERQTLALMNHPNIATVLDAGVTHGGRPFFAMELVEGAHIDRYCFENELSIRDRLKAFVMVCRGVHHAHQKGIVHRDLKPSNILVAKSEDQIVPKVIDFGIAMAVQSKPTNVTTEQKVQLIGTPQYMSPEQLRNETDIDTRSDIYSLGVVLYRMLTGTTPEPDHATSRPIFQCPSQCQTQNVGTSEKIAQDIDWITEKAMSPKRNQRYQSASELAMDIERYLHGQAVVASPGGRSYLLKKFIARNKMAVGSGLVAIVALLAGVFASTWGMIYANQQRVVALEQKQMAQDNEREALRLKEIAEAEARKLRVVANVLKNMLPEANPFRGLKSGFQIREHLDELINSVDAFSSEPELEAEIRITAARVYENISRYGRARQQYFKAREIRIQELGENHPKTLLCLVGMAACNIELGRIDAAKTMIEEVLLRGKEVAPRVHINALRTLRKILDLQQRYDEAFEIAKQFREYSKSVYEDEIFGQIHVANEYAVAAMRVGMKSEAEEVVRKSLDVLQRDHPARKFVIANTKHRLAEILMASKQFDDARQMAKGFIELQKETLGENDPYVIRGLILLAEIHRRDDDLLVAEQIALEAVQRAESLDEHQLKIRRSAQRELAKILSRLDLIRGASAWETAIQHSWKFLGGHVSVANDLVRLARIYEQIDDIESAADRLSRAIDILEHRQGTEQKLIESYEFYAQLLEQLNRDDLAKQNVQKAAALKSKTNN